MLRSTPFTHAGENYVAGAMPTFGAFRCKIFRGRQMLAERVLDESQVMADFGVLDRTLEAMIADFRRSHPVS